MNLSDLSEQNSLRESVPEDWGASNMLEQKMFSTRNSSHLIALGSAVALKQNIQIIDLENKIMYIQRRN